MALQAADYISKRRASSLIPELETELQVNAWAGWRDPSYVADHCSIEFSELGGPSEDELIAYSDEGIILDSDGAYYVQRLHETNPKFPARTRVQKKRLKAFRKRLTAHLDLATHYRAFLNGQPGEGRKWDSLRGWCQYIQRVR